MMLNQLAAARVIHKNHCSQGDYFLPKILNILVPQVGQTPVIARLSTPPLPFMATSLASFISLLALHLTQYPSVILICLLISLLMVILSLL